MGSVLAMKSGHRVLRAGGLVAALLGGLSACGNDSNAGLLGGLPVPALASAALAQVGIGGKPAAATAPAAPPDPKAVAAARKVLEDAGIPLYIIQDKSLGVLAYFGKLGQNGDVVTWSTTDYTSVSMRDGMVVATRGFGPDIMSSSGPTTDQIRRGKGTTARSYYYLDAADQQQRFDYSCTLSQAGTETVVLIGKTYRLRRVDETCTGQQGKFLNSFWFDGEAKLRQSSQFLAPGIEDLLLQKIID
jgi:hypothetical protein